MITTDLDRFEFTQASSENTKVFRSGGRDIPIQNTSHVKVYVTTTGNFSASDFANNKLALDSHPHLNTEIIRVSSSSNDLPLGLNPNTDYYVINKATNDWQVSLTEGGSVVAFTDAGSGTLTWTKTILKVLNTDYTVALTGTTATITWLTDKRPADDDKVLFLREVPFEQNTDLQNNSLFEAESVESQLDLIVNMTQQLKNTTERDFRLSNLLLASDATSTQATLNVTASDRADKALKFDSNGNLSVSTLDVDKIEDSVNDAKSYATEAGGNVNTYDAGTASATSDYSAKEWAVGTATTSAKDYATKTTGAVTGTDFSAKAWSVGGTDVTDTASRGAAKEWAIETSGNVDGTSYSAKEYAQGTQASTGGSAKSWAQDTDQVNGAGTNDRSAKSWSQGASMTGSTLGGSSKDWASLPVSTGTVDGTLYSSKAYSQSTTAGTSTYGGSAKGWASTAHGAAVPGAGADDRSALHYATDASNSATAAKNSAASVSNIFDSFDDTYLGRMADSDSQGTNPTTNGTWAKNSSTITVASGSNIKVGQVVTGTGMPTSPKPNVISVDGTTVIISENMVAAGSAVALTFTGYGVYGDYNTSKDGPALNNDGDALATGSLYFNSTDNEMRILDSGGNWIAATSAGDVSLLEYKFVTTSAQVTSKTYSGSADVGGTLSYTQDNIIVFMNGIQLKNGVDYTATNGSSIVLTNSASLSDEIAVIAFKSFTASDAVSRASGGTFASAVTFSAGLSAGDANITNVGSIALDSIVADGTSITISSDMETATNKKIKQKGAFMQSSTHQSWVLGG